MSETPLEFWHKRRGTLVDVEERDDRRSDKKFLPKLKYPRSNKPFFYL